MFLDLPGSVLFDPDEARYADIPREMVQSGDWRTFRLNGTRYFEKPPLLYWANAAAMKALGPTPFAARLAVRLSALGVTIMLFVAAGPAAALVYVSSLLPFALGRINLTDGLLTFFLTAAFLLLRRFIRKEKRSEPLVGTAAMFGTATALAMLAKGLIAILFPGLLLLLWVGLTRRWSLLKKIVLSPAPLIFFAVTVPAFLWIERHNPGFSHFFFIREHFQRYSTAIHERTGPAYYFVPVVLGGLLPWTVFLFSGFKRFWRDDDKRFFALWFLIPFLFFSLSHSKLIPYILPGFPALAVLVANGLEEADQWLLNAVFLTLFAAVGFAVAPFTAVVRELNLKPFVAAVAALIVGGAWGALWRSRKDKTQAFLIQAASWLGVIGILVFLIPRLSFQYSDGPLAAVGWSAKPDVFLCYRGYSHGLRWASDKNIPVVGFKGELASDNERQPELFIDLADFWRRWNSSERITAIVPRRGKLRIIDDFRFCPRQPVRLGQNHHSLLIANFDPNPPSV